MMSFRAISRFLIATAVGCCSIPISNASAGSGDLLITTMAQDEARKIPDDNTAFFSRADRKVRFQLVKFSGDTTSEMLAGTSVTVIDPNGAKSTLTADAEGIATLNDAKPGLHAIVVTGENGHTALPIALREGNAPAVAANNAEVAAIPPVKLPLMDIDPSELVRITSSYLPPGMGGSYEDIDSQFVSSGETTQGLQYRVRLGDDGTLSGQVYSLLQNGLSTSGVEGTNILIYRGNNLVGRTVADQFGKFYVGGLRPGVYGLCGIGAGGYSAFGFEAYNAASVAQNGNGQTLVSIPNEATDLVSSVAMQSGSTLPVVLIPPSMVPAVVQQIRDAYPPTGDAFAGGAPISSGIPGSGFGGGAGPAGGFGGGAGAGFGGGAGAGIGGAGGLLGLAAIGGITAAVAGSKNNSSPNPVVGVATNGGM